MAQQNKVQSVEISEVAQVALGKADPIEKPDMVILDERAPYIFENGMYKAEGVEGSFMSIDSLTRAWKAATKAKKLAEAKHTMRQSNDARGKTAAQQKELKEKAISERIKWQEAQ